MDNFKTYKRYEFEEINNLIINNLGNDISDKISNITIPLLLKKSKRAGNFSYSISKNTATKYLHSKRCTCAGKTRF